MSTSQPREKKGGYLIALLGGVSGAILLLLLGVLLAQTFVTEFLSQVSVRELTPVTFTVVILVSFGEVIGCWLALRWRRYRKAAQTAAWLAALLIRAGFSFSSSAVSWV